jgi:putative transposase
MLGLLRRRSRQHSRKQKGSANRRKSALRLARLQRRIHNIRTDWLHKLTTTLAKTKSVIVVEDLSVRGMMRNRRMSRSIADAGWSEFRRMLGYKTKWYGSGLRIIPRFEPTTKRCSCCGHVGDTLPLSERVFRCSACGYTAHRDLNAARNILEIGTESSSGTERDMVASNACGDRIVKRRSLKQETDAVWDVVPNG